MAAGRSNSDIAAALASSGRSGERHSSNLYCKIDARGKAEARLAEKMRELTGGISLPPGMKLPF